MLAAPQRLRPATPLMRLIFVNTSTSLVHDGAGTRPRVSRFRSSTATPAPRPKSSFGHSLPDDGPLAARAVESAHIDSFWRAYMPHARELPTHISRRVMGGWLLPVHAFYRSGDPLLRRILLSLAMVSAAARGHDDVGLMRERGLRLYGDALAEVSTALLCAEGARSNKIWGAVKLFSLYESHYGAGDAPQPGQPEPAQARNWLSHIEGQVSITLSRTPASFADGVSHCFFVDSRCDLIFASLVARKPTPLALSPWQTIPWTTHPKTPRDHLVDIFANVTSAVGSAWELGAACDVDVPAAHARWTELLSVCISIDQSLRAWHHRFGSDISCSLPPETADPSTPTIEQLAGARMMTIYWMTGMVLEQAVQDLQAAGEMLLGAVAADISLDTDTEECFRRLIFALPVFFQPAAGEFRMGLAATPMLLAMRHLDYLPRDRDFDEERATLARCMDTREGEKVRLMVLSLMQA
ncbi:hypothetical protein ACHAQA_003635 [Verticillium albo-atrum]